MESFRVLVVDDDSGLRLSVQTSLSSTGRFDVDEAYDGMDAIEKIKLNKYDIVLLDVDMPRMSGHEALKAIKEYNPALIVIILTAYATIDDAIQAVHEGAYHYISKPISREMLIEMVSKAIKAHKLISDVAGSAPILHEAGKKIIGDTIQMQKVFRIILRLSKVDTPVLIRGASGTGKELVARAIHFNSSHKEGKFVALNCSAIPENLFESELFGHEKGSFTGADQRKIGKFQYAEGGTLFLDELGDLPLNMQVKLLRVLQEKVFTPVGSHREIEAHVRIIAATNRPLENMIQNGMFREDLYYRLNVMPIFLPSLSERKGDLDHLTSNFIKKFNVTHHKKITGVSSSALTALKKYDWPGNIRELENVIEHAFILEETNQITLRSLPESFLESLGINLEHEAQEEINPSENLPLNSEIDLQISSSFSENEVESAGSKLDYNLHKEAFEREFIVKALKTFKGRINQTALHANIPKKTLLRKIEKYGIVAKDYV